MNNGTRCPPSYSLPFFPRIPALKTLSPLEVPLSVARVVLFNDVVLAAEHPMVDVITIAKTDLKAGDTLDALGGYMTYGQCENAGIVAQQNLLPIGLAEGCTVTRDIAKDEVLTYDDVNVPAGRLCDQLRQEQNEYFSKIIM